MLLTWRRQNHPKLTVKILNTMDEKFLSYAITQVCVRDYAYIHTICEYNS